MAEGDPLVPATWALVAVTLALVGATIVLAVFAGLQWRESKAARKDTTRQVELADASLAVSRDLLEEARYERITSNPLVISPEFVENHAGHAQIDLKNTARDAAMVINRVLVTDLTEPRVLLDQALAEGTIGAGRGWTIDFAWDPSRIGATIELQVYGSRLQGPAAVRAFRYRIDREGRLEDLTEFVTTAFASRA